MGRRQLSAHLPYVVAVVGVGAVGVSMIAQLCAELERTELRDVQIFAFDASGHFGPGVAYQMDLEHVLLNRTAANMSALAEDPSHFAAWLERMAYPAGHADEHLQRALFGHYLQDTLRVTAARAERHGVEVTLVSSRIDRVQPCDGGFSLHRGRQSWRADRVVMCTGNLRSRHYEHLRGEPGYHASPYPLYDLVKRIPRTARVGIIGSRLSAVDAAVNLRERGHTGPLALLSRQGWLPSVQGAAQPGAPLRWCTPERVAALSARQGGRLSYRTVLRLGLKELSLATGRRFSVKVRKPSHVDAVSLLRRDAGEAASQPQRWQAAFVALNGVIAQLWDVLSDADKRRFRERDFSRFMALRVSIPLKNAHRLLDMFDSGELRLHAGLQQVTKSDDVFIAQFRNQAKEHFDAIVNCTGAENDLTHTDNSPWRQMMCDGFVRAHALGGVDVDFHSSEALRADGMPLEGLFVVGNLTTGKHLFCSVLDLNIHSCLRVSRQIVGHIADKIRSENHVPPSGPTSMSLERAEVHGVGIS